LTEAASFVVPVDKPEGPTSHDVVAIARRAFGVRRIGHTGTLDPFASGLLLLCVGHTTRIAEYLNDLSKTYRATARLDGATLTDDNTSQLITASEEWRNLETARIEEALQSQIGEIMQMPPQYSAKKIAGERAYDIARRGDVAGLTAVPVTIHDITLVKIDLPEIEFEVECSSGTYIRAIARDVGTILGTGGYLTKLRRTSIGKHNVARSVHLHDLADGTKVGAVALTPVQALSHLPAIEIDETQERAVRFGQSIEAMTPARGPLQLIREGKLIAIAEAEGSRVWPRKVLASV
jgi:tRNA pseudouridine55 synthase